MFKKLLLFSCIALSFATARAAYVPVTLTGFNHDVIAEGVGAASLSTTADVDATGSGYVFISGNFQQSSSAALPTKFLPVSGTINSANTPGLSFQMANYTGNNACRLTSTAPTDSLIFATPAAYGELVFIGCSGNGAASVNITVNFTDGTSQAPSTVAVADWYGGSGIAIANIGRALRSTGALDGQTSTTGPNLYEMKVTILPANYTKNIRSITFNRATSSSGAPHFFAIVGSTICSGAVTAGTTASSAGSSACSGVNFNLSLPTATAGVGITYQWQSSATGSAPWTNLGTAATQTVSQTAATTYRAFITCNGGTADTSTPITVTMKAANQCYCIPSTTNNNYYIANFTTTGGSSNVNNTTTGGATSNGYSDFTGTQTIAAMQGNSVNFASNGNGTNTFVWRVYVDWNQNGTFEASELMFTNGSSYVNSVSGSFAVPSNATPGLTRLRVFADYYASTGAPCTFSTTGPLGEAEDYAFNVIALPNCNGTPAQATATASMAYACASESIVLTASGSPATGLTNQWQSSIDNGVTWNDITGATTNPYTVTGQTVATKYRDKQVCTLTSSPNVYSTVVTVGSRSCYCTPTFTSGCSSWRLTNVTVGTINNSPSACATSNYLNLSTTVTAAIAFNMSITTNQYCAAGVYCDLNNDGDFDDADELLYSEPYSGAATSTVTPSITLPGYVPAGTYRMRVVCSWGTSPGAGQACATYQYGNFHDYTLNVNAAIPCVAPTAQPTALVTTAGVTIANLSFTAATPAADRYLIIRTPGVPFSGTLVNGTNYTVGTTIGNGVVVSNAAGTTYTDNGLTPVTSYTYTIFAQNSLCFGGPLYNTTNPLTGTILTSNYTTYTWNGSVSTNWTTPANWTPARTVPDPNDILQFTDGLADTAKNVPTQTIKRLIVSNNTSAFLQAAATSTLTIADTVAATNDLDIAAGSSLTSNGNTAALTIAFSGANNKANIAGTLESISNAVNNVFDFTNTTATVTAAGTLAAGGSNSAAAVVGSNATNLQVNGLFNYKYTTNTVALPIASWNTGSTVKISGYTTVTGGPNGGQNQTFYNFTYDCPNQTSTANWSGTGALTVLNNFTVASTGTGTWQYATTQAYAAQVKNYIQTGGTFDLEGASASSSQVFSISGNFTKSGGTLKASGTTAASQPTINFNGTAAQTATFDASPAGQFVYRFSNPAGVTLVGTGSMTTFNINNNGGVRITTTAANPVTTTMAIAYGTTNTTLYYDTTGSYTMTANVFPTTAGPQNLTIATGLSSNIVTMPFSRTVPGTLTMSSGDINLGANVLTLGSSATVNGTLSYTAGNIRITTGSFVRWYGTTGSPNSISNTGLFPVSSGALSRAVNVFFASATSVTTGGTIAVGHTNATGLTTGLTVADGTYTINQRTNASWTITPGNGIAIGTSTMNVRLLGTGLLTSSTPANLRMMQANAVAGTHVNGAAPAYAQRSGLSLADLAVPYYIGAATTDLTGTWIAINSGPWSTGTTWDVGTPPASINDAFINPGVTVTTTGTTNVAKSLNILPGGTLTAGAGTLTIDSAVQNNGTMTVSGGTMTVNGNSGASGVVNNPGATVTVSSGALNIGTSTNGKVFTNSGIANFTGGTTTLGITGGGNAVFTNNANATLNVTGGTLAVNGNINAIAASVFNQSGGDIKVDGNAAGVAANSVASGTAIVSFKTQLINFTAGNFTIVDPHANTTASNTFEFNGGAHVNILPPHTFIFGDGTSTDAGGNATNGMRLNTYVGSYRISFGHMIVNGGAGTNRYVTNTYSFGINGNLTINNGGEIRMATTMYAGGNVTVNTGGTLTTNGSSLYFASLLSGNTGFVATPQIVANTGTIRNSTNATPTANANSVYFYNTNGVTFNQDFAFSGTIYFNGNNNVPSKAIASGTNRLIEISGAGVSGVGQTTGWVVGRYQKAASGSLNHNFPIGDMTYYAPVNVSGTAATGGSLIASTTGGDHPNLGASTINRLASVNRYYTVDTTAGLTITAGTGSVTLNWNAADMDANLTPANLVVGNYKGTTWSYPTVASPAATSIKGTGLGSDVVGQYAVGEPCGTAAIVVVTPPANVTACLGSSATFRVSTTPKAGLSYQWRKGTANIVGATDSFYTIPAVAAADAGSYSVVISSGCTGISSVTSAAGTLTINTPAAISTQPAATQDICEGSPATFTVAATGTGITYQWRKNGAPLTGNGANTATYTIPSVSLADSANYTVDVIGSAPCGSVTSSISRLTVKPLPLTITAGSAVNFCPGGQVILTAPATAPTNTLTYQWRQGGNPITPSQTARTYTATTTGSYTAVITNTANGCSNTSNAIAVSVNGAPQSVITPTGTISTPARYCAGTSIVLHGLNTAGLTYEWYLNGNTSNVLGTDSVYTATTPGSYTLKVSIGTGCSTTSIATVVDTIARPVVTITPSTNQTICTGDSVTLTGFYTGGTPAWNFNGNPIAGATNNTYKAGGAGFYSLTVTSTTTGCKGTSAPITLNLNPLPSVTITSANAATFCAGLADTLKATPTTGLSYVWNVGGTAVTPAATAASYPATATGSYTVTVTDANGCKKTSNAIAVTANPLPNIVVTPSLPLTMCTGQTNNLCVPTATGQTYQWSNASGPMTGATSACLAVTTAGNYSVKVTTSAGCTATSSVNTVVVNPTPVSTITNAGTFAGCAGDTICLNANTGTGLTYQWRQNGNPAPGNATSSTYCATASGNYTVVVTNGSNCSATSAIQQLNFNPRPTSVISYTTPVTFCDGGAVVLTGVSDIGTTYQWMNNGSPIPGATSNNYIASTTGNYSVVITAPNGCARTSQSLLVVNNPIPNAQITQNGQILSTGNFATYQWYLNTQRIAGATNQSYFATQNGGYAVAVTDANGCTDYSDVYMFNNLGVGGSSINPGSVKVFPNPTRAILNINAPAVVNLVVRDLTGREVMRVNDAKQIDMSTLADGTYMLMISDKNGIMVKTDKVMKIAQ